MALAMDPAVFASKRKELGFTQDRLAEVIGVNKYTIKKWEGQDRKIPPYMIYVFEALKAGLQPVNNDLFPPYMLYAYAALQAGLEPVRNGVLADVTPSSSPNSDDI